MLLSSPVEADAYESFPLQLCQHLYLNQPLQLPQYSVPALFMCYCKVLFSGGEASEGWEGLLFQSHPGTLGRCSHVS